MKLGDEMTLNRYVYEYESPGSLETIERNSPALERKIADLHAEKTRSNEAGP